jgi:threonine dehydrogenase-like Zn-dependent dehydrogenase
VYVAHQSQLVRVQDSVSDQNAILVDAVSSALHPILQYFPGDADTVLVAGAGTIGLCAVASLRALGSKARILILAKYPFQGDLARRLGADEIIYPDRKQGHYGAVAELTGGKVYEPVLGKPVLVGGADLVYECVGNDSSLDDALRLARAGGRVVIVGAAGTPKGVDWSPIWFHELAVVGSYAVSTENYQGQPLRTYEVCLELMAQGKLDLTSLLTHTFPLAEYRKAFRILESKRANRALKVAFSFD